MGVLIAGVVLWSTVHLFPSVASGLRSTMIDRLGSNSYRGLFALLILSALAMIIIGWKTATPHSVYIPLIPPGLVASTMMLAAFILFVAAQSKTNIKRYIRHPQLTAVALWAIAHLLANGESRSIILFGGFGAWAVLSMALINRRDGAREKPAPVSAMGDVLVGVIGIIGFAAVTYFHRSLFGVPAVQ